MKHAISLELKNHGKGDNHDSFSSESGFLKIKDEPMDCNEDYLKDKSNDTTYWDTWANANYGMAISTTAQATTVSDNQLLNSVANSVYGNATSNKLPEVTSPIGSDIQSPLSGQHSPVTPTSQTSWSQGNTGMFPAPQNNRPGLISPISPNHLQHGSVMPNDRQIPSWQPDRNSTALPNENHGQFTGNERQLGPGPVRNDRLHGSVLPDKPYGPVPGSRLTVPEMPVTSEAYRQSNNMSGVKSRTSSVSSVPSTPTTPNPNVSRSSNGSFDTSPLMKFPIIEPKNNHREEVMDEKLKAVNEMLAKNKNMDEFIGKIVEAGKCLQLLNYRVSIYVSLKFDTSNIKRTVQLA